MPIDRRLLGEDDFFEPQDLGFVSQPAAPAAPIISTPAAALPGPGLYEGFTPEALAYVTRPGALERRVGDVRDVLADDFQLYKQIGQSGDTWGGKTTTYQAYDPYGGAGGKFDVTESGLEKGLEIAAKMGASLAATAGLGAPLGQFLQVPAAFAPAVGNAILGGISTGDARGALLGGLGSLAQAGMGNVVKDIGTSVAKATDIPMLGDVASSAVRSAVQAAPGALLANDPSRILTGALTGGLGQAAGLAFNQIMPEEPTNLNEALLKAGKDLVGAAVGSALTGKDVNLVNTLLPSVTQYISDEYKIAPDKVNTLLNTAVKAASGDKFGLNDLTKIGMLLGSSATPPADALAGPSELSKSTLASDILSGTVVPDTNIQDLADTILGKGDEVTFSPLPLEFVQPSGQSVSLPDEFISSLAPEQTETFPVESRDLRSADQRIETIGRREEKLDRPLDSYLAELFGGTSVLPGQLQGPSTIETTGRREEDLDLPLDIYLPELFGAPPRAGELQGPSTIETTGKRPTEPVTSIPSFLIEDILREGVPDEKTPSQIADEILGEQQRIETTGKRPVEPVTPIPSFLDDVQIRQEPLPDTKTPAQLAAEILPPSPPVATPAPSRTPTPVSPPTPAKREELDLSALFALLGAMGQRPEAAEAYQLANVAPGVEAGLRAIEQMYGIRRG